MMKIAILDDDPEQIVDLTAMIPAETFSVHPFRTAAALLSALRRDTFDLLIIDWGLPDRSGTDVIGWVHLNIVPSPPMLLVTSRSGDENVAQGLGAGADDYLSKPISPIVLNARITALLRRAYPHADKEATVYAGLAFDSAESVVVRDGRRVKLTAKEFLLALTLFRNVGRALARSYLLEAVWGADPGLHSRSLDVHISHIRSKLNLRPDGGFRLTPVYSYGYRLEVMAQAETAWRPEG